MTVVSALLAAHDWRDVLAAHLWQIAAVGLAGAVAQMCLIEAFRAAPASVIAPFEYTALFWGITIDWVVWDALPSMRVLAGGAIVVGSGLYIIWRERRLELAPLTAACRRGQCAVRRGDHMRRRGLTTPR